MRDHCHPVHQLLNLKYPTCGFCYSFIASSVCLDAVQAASVLLELQDLLLRTGLKDRSRLLLGPFCCSTSLEARWCRHSGSPGPEPGVPKLLLDLKGGLMQVCPWHQFNILNHKIYDSTQFQLWRSGSYQHLCTWLELKLSVLLKDMWPKGLSEALPVRPTASTHKRCYCPISHQLKYLCFPNQSLQYL